LTEGCVVAHNRSEVLESSSTSRAAVGVTLALSVAFSATVAPEHVHEADADHPRSAVHRHLQPHDGDSPDRDHALLADEDQHIVWLDAVARHEAGYRFAPPAVLRAEPLELVSPLADWASPPDYDVAPPHGPPRACLSPRAPPSLSPDLI
jgi:hypothetical protein